MICYLKNKTHVNRIMSEDDIVTLIVSILLKNYFKLPRQAIGENANLICLFPQDLKNHNHIFDDRETSDMTKEFVIIELRSKKT